jgi:hypothetical protein
MSKEPDDERRASSRVRLQRGVMVTLRGTSHDTHTINVSTGGASIELVAPPDRGARGSISLSLSEGPAIDLLVEVRWTSVLSTIGPAGADRRHLVGLQFLEVPADALARLTAAIAAEEDDEDDD